VTVRKDKQGNPRAWVKVADPKDWRPRAVVIWESIHGRLPEGQIVHHENRNTLDDRPENLVAISRSEHLQEHRTEFEDLRRQRVIEVLSRRRIADALADVRPDVARPPRGFVPPPGGLFEEVLG
jgi:hypothetical protein